MELELLVDDVRFVAREHCHHDLHREESLRGALRLRKKAGRQSGRMTAAPRITSVAARASASLRASPAGQAASPRGWNANGTNQSSERRGRIRTSGTSRRRK